jgi:CheY-like chemotaxis protein
MTATEPRLGRTEGPGAPTASPFPGLRVLLAEGDAGNAEFTTLLLGLDGHQVQVARDGPSALRMAQADPPDVLVLEIRLPGLNGWEVTRRVREQASPKKPFCIAVTTCDTAADRRRSEEAGIDLHLVKPVDTRSLRGVLRRLRAILGPPEGVLAPPLLL